MFVLGLRGVSSIRLELTFQTWILQVWNDKAWIGHIRKSKWNIQEHQLLTLVQSPHNDLNCDSQVCLVDLLYFTRLRAVVDLPENM